MVPRNQNRALDMLTPIRGIVAQTDGEYMDIYIHTVYNLYIYITCI